MLHIIIKMSAISMYTHVIFFKFLLDINLADGTLNRFLHPRIHTFSMIAMETDEVCNFMVVAHLLPADRALEALACVIYCRQAVELLLC